MNILKNDKFWFVHFNLWIEFYRIDIHVKKIWIPPWKVDSSPPHNPFGAQITTLYFNV